MRNLVIGAAIVMASWQTPALAARYIVTDLGTLGGNYSEPYAINDRGQVVGRSYTADGSVHGFIYSDGVMSDIGVLPGGGTSEALNINNAGQVVGYATDASNHAFPILYSGGTISRLGTAQGAAMAINDAGQIVGSGLVRTGPFTFDNRAFSYNNGTFTPLGSPPAFGGSFPSAINEAGLAAGRAAVMAGVFHAVLLSGNTTIDLGTLAGDYSEARDINAAGHVVGVGASSDNMFRAFLYTGGALQDLGTFGGPFAASEAYGINDLDQVVGSATYNDEDVAFLYEGGQLQNLNDLIDPQSGFFLRAATAINASGQIVGRGYLPGHTDGDADFFEHALLLTPLSEPPSGVPEPATWALMITGFGAVGGALRRRGAQSRIKPDQGLS